MGMAVIYFDPKTRTTVIDVTNGSIPKPGTNIQMYTLNYSKVHRSGPLKSTSVKAEEGIEEKEHIPLLQQQNTNYVMVDIAGGIYIKMVKCSDPILRTIQCLKQNFVVTSVCNGPIVKLLSEGTGRY